MEDLRNCFELNKQTMIKMFDAMAKASTATSRRIQILYAAGAKRIHV